MDRLKESQALIDVAVSRPWVADSLPDVPLPGDVREKASAEIGGSAAIRDVYAKLDPTGRRNVDWFETVAALEKERALWSLLTCLWHPSSDVQLKALAALGRLRDERAVPTLLVYADDVAVARSGSEDATIHGLIHEALANTLSTLTGVTVTVHGQSPDELRRGIERWRAWLAGRPRGI